MPLISRVSSRAVVTALEIDELKTIVLFAAAGLLVSLVGVLWLHIDLSGAWMSG